MNSLIQGDFMSASVSLHANHGFAAAQAASALLRRNPAMPDQFFSNTAAPGAPAMRFAADEEIYAEGDAAASFYKVEQGVVRVCKYLSDGRRQIDAFYTAGDVFGFEAGETYGFGAEAVTHCTLTPYRRSGLERMVAGNDAMALKLFSYAMLCVQRSRAHALLLGRGSATQKLAAFLGEMFATKPSDEAIELAMTRQDIADYLGLTIETVSRTLSQFERDGIIKLATSRRINLKNRTMLRQLNA
jgi:CRP/FNR family nitrogen fixation transcriptional regulator